ncbi:FGGY-family carbohydrate kinase [Arthrobacter mobilis]|uniref:FGGY-family carbohydrate kinase n=1 Tax=Arthrobacter mobilis TaxID=2724944 RepID=A0A7X6K2K7_9MICC|nr:FGGY-family carbohydrate kinase [Arthrobacter mobilis]NKX53302.1 FGGY-family carbohydrate kinase [Arthrobacter mobilis]
MFLGIDIGTGSSKAVVADADGHILDSVAIGHEVSFPRPGWAEFDAEGTGWAEVAGLCRELFSRHDAAALAGVCVSAMGPCLVVTDENLVPLRPAILYGIDARATAEIEELTQEFGAEAIFADSGKVLSSQAVGPKIRWLRNREPEVFARARRWHSLNSYILAKLTGEYVLDHHTASQCDPLYDLRRNQWHPDRYGAVAGHLPMPGLAWPAEVAGRIHAEAAEATGLPAGVPVCAGTVDAWAEAFSAAVRRPGDLMLMYGSTMFFVQVLGQYRAEPKLWTTAGVDEGSLTLAAGMSTSGSLTTWMQRLFGNVPFETLVAEAAAVPPGSDGLLLLPYFAGERTPVFDPDARGLITGLSLRHGRGHLFRATYEGIGFGIRQILEYLENSGEPIRRVAAVGGGTKARLWTEIVSDITGREQIVPAQTIGASYGDALLAAIGTGAVPPDTEWARTAATVKPRAANAPVYDRLYATYGQLYPANREHMHVLAALQEPEGGQALPGSTAARQHGGKT